MLPSLLVRRPRVSNFFVVGIILFFENWNWLPLRNEIHSGPDVHKVIKVLSSEHFGNIWNCGDCITGDNCSCKIEPTYWRPSWRVWRSRFVRCTSGILDLCVAWGRLRNCCHPDTRWLPPLSSPSGGHLGKCIDLQGPTHPGRLPKDQV